MSACRTIFLKSISSLAFNLRSEKLLSSVYTYNSPTLCFSPLLFTNQGLRIVQSRVPVRCYASAEGASVSTQTADLSDEGLSENQTLESPENLAQDTVENLLTHTNEVTQLMKMERRPIVYDEDEFVNRRQQSRWFPYLDSFKCGSLYLSSEEVLEAMGPHIMESRKERFRNVARYRSYSVCLVIEGLSDFGNVSAVLRSADALGFQSVHVVSCDSSKRYKDNRHVSMGAEKWLDIELWNSAQECFKVLTCRGYRIATTHVGMDVVSIYEMDWSFPTAIVVGNENRGISNEALQLSDLHCSIPMKGMVDSFNVSVAAGILMHHAVCDRISRLGCHGDLTLEERQILLAEFSLRHSKSSISIANEYAKRKAAMLTPKL